MKKFIVLLLFAFLYTACEEWNDHPLPAEHPAVGAWKYPGDVAVEWNKLEMRITRGTAGFGPGPAVRVFAYAGLTLYESIVEGMPGFRSVAGKLMGMNITAMKGKTVHFPASANAAYAFILRNMIPTASAENKARIDSLELAFNEAFKKEINDAKLTSSADYGRGIASSIFEWSKTDGFADAGAKNATYVIPVGEGLWEKTPPAFAAPINVFLGDVRTFAPNSANLTMPGAPTAYSSTAGSPFYNMVNDVYTISQNLTPDDITTVQTWGDAAGNYSNGLRYVQICIQLVDDADLPLNTAALAFARHHMSIHDATIDVFKAKYKYNLVRPITYIRNVMGFTTWNTVIATPPHPEYPAAHATLGGASSHSLEGIFGTHYAFTDRSHQATWGARQYNSLDAYAVEAGWSRVLGGIHYKPSVDIGRVQGRKAADLVDNLGWRVSGKWY